MSTSEQKHQFYTLKKPENVYGGLLVCDACELVGGGTDYVVNTDVDTARRS